MITFPGNPAAVKGTDRTHFERRRTAVSSRGVKVKPGIVLDQVAVPIDTGQCSIIPLNLERQVDTTPLAEKLGNIIVRVDLAIYIYIFARGNLLQLRSSDKHTFPQLPNRRYAVSKSFPLAGIACIHIPVSPHT